MATRPGIGLLLLFALGVSGCGGEDLGGDRTDAGSGGAGASGGAGGNSGTAGSGGGSSAECPSPGFSDDTESVLVGTVSASVTDDAGTALPGMLAQVCGIDLCIDVDVLENGNVLRTINERFLKPAFKYGDAVSHAQFAELMVPDSEGNVDLGSVRTWALPPLGSGAELLPGRTVESAGVELELAPDFVAAIDPFDFETAEEQAFRAVTIPADEAPGAVDPELGFEIVIALTPARALLCPAAVLTVPNTPAWPAGSAVEVFVHGLAIEELWAPYAGWAKVSDGVVSDDGSTVTTRGAQGLPTLSVIGIRLAE